MAKKIAKKIAKTVKTVGTFTDNKSFFELCSGTDYSEMFDFFNHFPKSVKTSKIRVKSADTFVAAVHAAYIANKLTEELYKEIAIEHKTATHRFKAYLNYFKTGKYVVA
jgi:predicted nucleotide-binding protein (sugar kinase/HSP70/actin superfamily)